MNNEDVNSDAQSAPAGMRVAYIMSRFPKITETFILNEMLAAEAGGVTVEIFPLRRERTNKMHPEARDFTRRAHFLPLMSIEILRDNLRALLTTPVLWLSTLWTVVRANFGCRRLLTGALAVFPRSITVARRMRQLKIDHIHAHFASHPAAAAWIVHQFSGIPYSFVAHGSDLHRDRDMLTEKVEAASFVVAISGYNRRMILDETGTEHEDKVRVIHCGVNPDEFCPDTEQSPADSDGPLRVFCIGTLHEVKGQKFLIEAVADVISRGVRIELHLIGDGPDRDILIEKVNAAGLNDVVIFEGRRDRQEIMHLLQQADVLVAPSVPTADGRREGIPVALMEGMASGVAVVASRLSGIPELVDHEVDGLLTDPGDTAALATALQQLAADPSLRERLAAAGRSKVVDRFNLQTNTQSLLNRISQCRPTPQSNIDQPTDRSETASSETLRDVAEVAG